MVKRDVRGIPITEGVSVAYMESGGHYKKSRLRYGTVSGYVNYHNSDTVYGVGITSDKGAGIVRKCDEVLVLQEHQIMESKHDIC